jgi:hypothetical protein
VDRQELNEVERYILSTIKDMDFGSVEVTIHNSRIVQVETSRKRRFDSKQPA